MPRHSHGAAEKYTEHGIGELTAVLSPIRHFLTTATLRKSPPFGGIKTRPSGQPCNLLYTN
jgi:hypothetical protein